MKVEVITDNAWEKMESFGTGASCIRAVMAFWTIPAPDLPSKILAGLCRSGAFLCVDINQPTSINALNSLHHAGIHTRLHLMTTTGKSEIEDSVGMPNHLMHSKVIIFDYTDRDSIIWIGSHNGTFRALDGINYECSLAVVDVEKQSEIYQDVESHVASIYTSCQSFNPNLIEHYRYLQGTKIDNAVGVIEFENGSDQPLHTGEEITVFNMSRDDLRSFKTIDTNVIVSLHGSSEILYDAKVVQTGETPSSNRQTFSDRRYADRHRPLLPVLLGETRVTLAMYKRDSYFAIIKIINKRDVSDHLLEIPSQNAWIDLPSTELSDCAKVNQDMQTKKNTRSVKPKGLSFKVPAFEEMMLFDMGYSADIEDLRMTAFTEMQLEEKRAIKRPALVKRKLLIRR
jgi:PLD-like domain